MTTSSSPVRGRALLMSTAAASFVLSAALVAGPTTATAGTCTASGSVTNCTGDFPTGQSFTAPIATVNTDNTVTSEGPFTLTGAGVATFNNDGTLGAAPATDFSVETTGVGSSVVNNNGTLNGPISLAGSGNTVNNAGTWTDTGTSAFGTTGTADGNVLNNGGTLKVGTSSATFTELGTFNNSPIGSSGQNVDGVVDLTSGNSLNIGNAVFNGGPGSQLRVNANSPTGTLVLGSTGTGATQVVLADVPGTHPAMNFKGQTLVTGPAAGTGPSEGSFNLGGPGINDQRQGFVDYRLAFTPSSATAPSAYTLFGLPGPEVFEALNIPYALQDFWRHSAVAVTQRQMSIRDAMVGEHPTRPEGFEFWAVPFGGEDFFKRPQTFRFGGFSFDSIGNHNDTIGLQVGADVLANWLGGHGYWGFTGGVEQQTTHFQFDDANDLYSVGGNIGMYGGVDWSGFYVNLLGKVDWDNMNTNFFTAGFSPNNTYKAYGARGEAGYRWPWQGFFVEPSIRVNSIWTDGINLHPAGAALNFFNDDPVVDAEAGGRIGTTFNFGRIIPGAINPLPGQFNIYVGAWYADQWNGQNRMTFTTFGGLSPTSINLFQVTTGQFIHMEYGLETSDWFGGLKLFLKGQNDFNGDHVGGWAAQGGVRFSF